MCACVWTYVHVCDVVYSVCDFVYSICVCKDLPVAVNVYLSEWYVHCVCACVSVHAVCVYPIDVGCGRVRMESTAVPEKDKL